MVKKDSYDAIWMSWHLSRRSVTLSQCLEIPFLAIQYEGNAFLRHTKSAIWSVKLLVRHKPRTLFIQYSFLLLVIIALYKTLTPYNVKICCDCHTKALRRQAHGWGRKIFSILKKWSIGATDVVILSNVGQVKDLEAFSDRFLIVPDFIPVFEMGDARQKSTSYCLVPMSFDKDEPVEELADAAELIANFQDVYITGAAPDWLYKRFAKNPRVHVTGFIEDSQYVELLSYADCIISLTSEEGCLQCSGYEALALGIPFVTSDTLALREYFNDSAIFVAHEPGSIAEGVKTAFDNHEFYQKSMANLKNEKDVLQRKNVELLKNLLL